jgi:hypothetical protein
MNIYLPNSVKYLFRIIFGYLILLAGEVPLVTAQNTTILKNALGVVVGAPQTMAVFYERLIDRNISLQIHAGTVIVFSSAGIRLNWINNNHKFFPYLFMGSVLIHSEAEDAGDPYGTTGYLWLGTGIRYTSRRWILFGEFCAFLGGNENKGIGDDWIFPFDPAIAGGLQIRF